MRSAISSRRLVDLISSVKSKRFGTHSLSPTKVVALPTDSATLLRLFSVGLPTGSYELWLFAITPPHASSNPIPSESTPCEVFLHFGSQGQSLPPPNNPPRPGIAPSIEVIGLIPVKAEKALSPRPAGPRNAENCPPNPSKSRAVVANCGIPCAPPSPGMPGNPAKLPKD